MDILMHSGHLPMSIYFNLDIWGLLAYWLLTFWIFHEIFILKL